MGSSIWPDGIPSDKGCGHTRPTLAGRGRFSLMTFDRFQVLAVGDETHIALNIHVAGAAQGAGCFTVTGMVGEHQLKAGFAGFLDAIGPCTDHHAIRCFRGTGPDQTGIVLDLHHAEAAGTIYFQFIVITQVGDIDAVLLSHLKDGHAFMGRELDPVYIEIDS
jgi:hypothetical protein